MKYTYDGSREDWKPRDPTVIGDATSEDAAWSFPQMIKITANMVSPSTMTRKITQMCLNNPNLFVTQAVLGLERLRSAGVSEVRWINTAPEVVDRIAEAPPITRVRFILERLPSCHLSR